jgi:hypothetical protein
MPEYGQTGEFKARLDTGFPTQVDADFLNKTFSNLGLI